METTPALPAPEKRRRVPPKVRRAIDHIVQGRAKTITAAAKKVGLSRERLSRALNEPHISAHLRDAAARMVAIGAGRASARMLSLIDAKSEHVSADISRHILAVAGIKPAADANVNLNVDVRAGIVIDLREPEEIGLKPTIDVTQHTAEPPSASHWRLDANGRPILPLRSES